MLILYIRFLMIFCEESFIEKPTLTVSSLPVDRFGFSNERLDKEDFSHWPGRVPSHCLLGESRIHGLVQASSCTLGVDVGFFQPLCLHAWNDAGEKPSNHLLRAFLRHLSSLRFCF